MKKSGKDPVLPLLQRAFIFFARYRVILLVLIAAAILFIIGHLLLEYREEKRLISINTSLLDNGLAGEESHDAFVKAFTTEFPPLPPYYEGIVTLSKVQSLWDNGKKDEAIALVLKFEKEAPSALVAMTAYIKAHLLLNGDRHDEGIKILETLARGNDEDEQIRTMAANDLLALRIKS